jgi:glycosyltransferase involved in cell wall biosynthesis
VTAKGLDRQRFEPIVLFFQPNHFADRLKELGVKVLFRCSRQFWEKESYIRSTQKARSRLPQKGMLGSLRKQVVSGLRALVGGIPMAWTIYRVLRRENIDLLHANNSLRRDSMVILAGLLARVPVVVHERQLARCSLFTRLLSRKVRALICISDAVLEFTQTSGARTPDRRRIHNALDLDAFRLVKPALPPGPPRVGIVGRIMPKKGQRHFLQAAVIIRERLPATEFYIIGQSTEAYRAYEEELRALASSLGLDSSLKWTGYLEDPLGLMASLDVIVHAAIEPEPFGRVIMEALALGRPVIATRLGGPVEIIEDGVSGFLVPPGDPSAIAQTAISLLEDKTLALRVKEAALLRAEERFGLESYIRQIEEVYKDALEGNG